VSVRPLLLLILLTIDGCGAAHSSRGSGSVAPWLRADPQRCLLPRDLKEGMEVMAERCAEAFVRQNGYTDAPATSDSTRWVLEEDEGGSWPDVLEARGGSLAARAATVQCSRRECLVFFQVRRILPVCALRVVSMTQVFTHIRLEPGALRDLRCTQRRI
jgi:hypothetical protein